MQPINLFNNNIVNLEAIDAKKKLIFCGLAGYWGFRDGGGVVNLFTPYLDLSFWEWKKNRMAFDLIIRGIST